MDQWEKMASDRSKWRKLIHESIESFENSCMQYSAYKRLIRKGEQAPTPGPQSHHANCDICGNLCLSRAGLKSHLRKCAKSILHPNNVTANKTDRLGQFCGKICHSLAWRVIYEHIQFKGGAGEGERTWDKGGGHARNREYSHHHISCVLRQHILHVSDVTHRKRGLSFEKSQLSFAVGRRRLIFACSPKPCGRCRTWFGADGKVSIERLCLSPYVEKHFNSKVIKSFVPELRSRKCFCVSGFLCYIYIWVMNILCTFHISVYHGYVTNIYIYIYMRVCVCVCCISFT